MKKYIFITSLLLWVMVATAQDWQVDFETAKQEAKRDNKKIVLVFQGSDWCAPCIKLDKEIWSSEQFKTLAKKEFIMVKVDFPRKKANKLPEEQQTKNNYLAEKYNTRGYFPYVVVLNSEGSSLGSTGYKKVSPKEYFEILTKFK